MTLTKMARQLDVTVPWCQRQIVKYKISGASGQKGYKSDYSSESFNVLRKARGQQLAEMENTIKRFKALNSI